MKPYGLPPARRLRKRAAFVRAQSYGRRSHGQYFLICSVRADDPTRISRLGITVTKKVAGAVGRNRIKRLVREVFRRYQHRVPSGLDIVWIARHKAQDVRYADVLRAMERWLGGCGG